MRLLLLTVLAFCVGCVYTFQHVQEPLQEASALQTQEHAPSQQLQQQQQQRRNNALAKFSIPIFAFSWSSPNVLQGDVREDLHLLGSTVAGPLKDIVQDFVYQSFRIQLARLAADETLPEMVRTLKTVNFNVNVVYNERNKEEDHSLRQRHLQTASRFDFYAEFQGWAYFIQPSDPSTMPTEKYMTQTLGSWREAFMVEDYVILVEELHKSDDPILKNLGNLVVLNDVQPGDLPYPPETHLGANVPTENQQSKQRSISDLWFSFLVVLGAATFVGTLFLVRPYVFKPRQFEAHQGAFPHAGDKSTASATISLPGRGEGSEGEEMDTENMEESDRWLQQHRPALFRALKRAESFRNTNQQANGSDGIMNDSQNTRSNPLQFLYGGMFVRRNRANQLPSASLASRDAASMEEAEEDVLDSTPSWWQKLTQSLQGQTLACDEDPSQYDFAFSDFPRHDGTPCLIFSETDTGPALVRVTTRPEAASNQALSNEDFKRQLSMHDLGDSGLNAEDDRDGDPEFTNKLERLIAMRHRHYEKELIIQKGRKARDEEKRAEARKRELQLRRHEMELDLEEIEASLTPRALSRKSFQSQQSFEQDVERKKTHRVIMSDSNYFSAVDGAGEERNAVTVELTTIGGPSLRHDSEDIPPPPPRGYSHSRNLSDSSPRKLLGVDRPKPHPLRVQPMKHRRSHRRSFSHGTQETEEKKIDHVAHKRNDSNADDVMAFGIAAYTNFT